MFLFVCIIMSISVTAEGFTSNRFQVAVYQQLIVGTSTFREHTLQSAKWALTMSFDVYRVLVISELSSACMCLRRFGCPGMLVT